MSEYVSISEVVEVASGAARCKYQLIPGKKIMFESRLENGESIAMCTPQSKFHPQGFYWTDITSVQYELLDSYDNAIVIFRLQGRKLTMLKEPSGYCSRCGKQVWQHSEAAYCRRIPGSAEPGSDL